jgi:hypothetical protein
MTVEFDKFDEQEDPEMQRIIPFEDLEKEIYVDRLTTEYEGPFDIQEIRTLFNNWSKEHHYAKDERDTKELVKEGGKDIHLIFRLQKWVSNKFLAFMNIMMDFTNVTDIEVEKDGKKIWLQKGKVKIVINGFLASSGEKDRWEAKAHWYFLRELIDKFVYKIDRGKYSGILISDAGDITQKLKALMSTTRYKMPQHEALPVEDERKDIEEKQAPKE